MIDLVWSVLYIFFLIPEHLSVQLRLIYLGLFIMHSCGVNVKNSVQMFYPIIIFSIFAPYFTGVYNIFGDFNLHLNNLIKNKFKTINCHEAVVNNIEMIFALSLFTKLLIFFYVHKYFKINMNSLSLVGYLYIIAYLYVYPIDESYALKKIQHNSTLFNSYLIITTLLSHIIVLKAMKYVREHKK